ncbi:MAG: leucine-rich repeat domain-containing protein [Bacteroidales bacterium]|nr:leucine-rich repeat domain-containing protein [Bacteroidales bacterium]
MTYEEQLPGFMHPLYDYDTMLVIPSSVIHNNITYSVSSIDEKAFLYEKGIRRIELPSSVITIQSNAFVRSSLQEIVMPNVQTIGYNSFGSTQLTHINLPSTISSLGENAFSHSLLEEVEVPSGVSMIPNGCFYGCPLRSITLHEGLQAIGDNAFTCYLMDSLTLPSTLQYNRKDWGLLGG